MAWGSGDEFFTISPNPQDAAGATFDAIVNVVVDFTGSTMNGDDTWRGMLLDFTNTDHTGASNFFYALEIDEITGDANATEAGLVVGSGWDFGASLSGISRFGQIDVNSSNPATVSYSRFGTATTGHGLSTVGDVLFSGNLEVDGNVFFDGTTSASGPLEITSDGTTTNQLKLTDSSVTETVALSVNDGDFQIRLSSASNNFSDEYIAFSIASQSGGVNVGAPQRPQFAGNISGAGSPNFLSNVRSVYVSGKYAYVAARLDDSFGIFDISDPSSPSFVSNIVGAGSPNLLNGPSSVYVSGKYAYVTALDSGDYSLTIIDISNPVSPVFAGNIGSGPSGGSPNFLNTPTSVYVSGKYAYVATLNDGLTIIDISNPSNPTFAGNISGDGSPHFLGALVDVYVSGKYAYVAANTDDSLTIIDVSDPSNPTFVGNIAGGDSPNFLDAPESVYVSGKYAYVAADTDNSFGIFDISDPSSPSLVSNIVGAGSPNFLSRPRSVHVSGKYAYVAALNDGLTVIDVSDPLNPTPAGNISGSPNFLDGADDVYVSGKYAYVAVPGADDSLTIIDLGGLDTPTLSAGDINTSSIEVTDNIDIGNDLYVRGGGVFGRGLLVNGRMGISVASLSDNTASVSAESLFRVSHAKGYLSGDIIDIAVATSTSQEFFTGNFQRFTLAGSDIFLVESSGAVVASGAAQFGGTSTVAYSRFGTGTTGHSNYISASDDLLISGDLETVGSVSLGSDALTIITGGNVGIGTTNASDSMHIKGSSTAGAKGLTLTHDQVTSGIWQIRSGITGIAHDSLSIADDGSNRLVIDAAGDVGIGTTAPAVILHAYENADTVIARIEDSVITCDLNPNTTSPYWSCSSDERIKEDINNIDNALDTILALQPKTYSLRGDPSKKLIPGFIAQEVELIIPSIVEFDPTIITSYSMDGTYKMSGIPDAYIVSAIQELNAKLDSFGVMASSQSEVTASSSESLDEGVIFDLNILFQNVIKKFAEMYNIVFDEGLIQVAKIVTDNIEAKFARFNEIEVDNIKTKGITIYDSVTGEPFCLNVENGVTTTKPGICQNQSISTPTLTPAPSESPTPTPEPTVSPSPTPEASPTPEPTESPSPTPEPIETPEPTPSPEPTQSPTPEPTLEPTPTPTPTPEPTPEPTPTLSPSPEPTPSSQL